jgi:dTDP-4-dehydrorhamnose reductase
MRRLKVFVAGGGKFAYNWCIYTNHNFENIVVSKSDNKIFQDNKYIKLNLTKYSEMLILLDQIRPDIVINSAAITNVDYCEKYPIECKEINTKVALTLADFSNSRKIKFIQISTDHFESGPLDLRNEAVLPLPINQYGISKIEADKVISDCKSNIIIRTNFFGMLPKISTNSFTELCNTLISGRIYPGFSDIQFTPIATPILVQAISKLILLDYSGIINIVGDDNISKFNFAKLVAKAMDLRSAKVSRITYDSMTIRVPRPKQMGLLNTKLQVIFPDFPGGIQDSIKIALEQSGIGDTNYGRDFW